MFGSGRRRQGGPDKLGPTLLRRRRSAPVAQPLRRKMDIWQSSSQPPQRPLRVATLSTFIVFIAVNVASNAGWLGATNAGGRPACRRRRCRWQNQPNPPQPPYLP